MRLLRWLGRTLINWRTARSVLLTLAIAGTLVALFYAVENWRGRRVWAQVHRELAARGEQLEFESFIPPALPDDQNFAMAPLFQRALRDYSGEVVAFALPSARAEWARTRLTTTPDWHKGEQTDLAVWQQYYRQLSKAEPPPDLFPIPPEPGDAAADVLFALSRWDGELAELRIAAERPACRFPLHYENLEAFTLPHLGPFQGISGFLRLRVLAELERNLPDPALDDLRLILRLAESLKSEPTLLSYLVRQSILDVCLGAIWQGNTEHCWNDTQLAEIERELRHVDLLSGLKGAMRAEHAGILRAFEYFRASRDLTLMAAYAAQITTSRAAADRATCLRVLRWMPAGWYDQNKAAYANFAQQLALPRVESSPDCIRLGEWRQRFKLLTGPSAQASRYQFLAVLMLHFEADLTVRALRGEAYLRLARTACALERYWLAHAEYPAQLSALAPQYLAAVPRDVVDGADLKYARTGDARFILYSVGGNGQDDGGKVSQDGWGREIGAGDWVWPSLAQ